MSTDATALGDLTVSMLRGEEGNQRKEVEKLIHWLAQTARPDVIHLSNSMLVGMAREIRRQLNVPIVCTLSGEDIFLEKLSAPWYELVRRELRECAGDVTAFISLNRYYADFMTEYAGIPREKIDVIPHGLKLGGHGTRRRKPGAAEFVIGYMARICEDKGLHHLVEAFALLAKDNTLPRVVLCLRATWADRTSATWRGSTPACGPPAWPTVFNTWASSIARRRSNSCNRSI